MEPRGTITVWMPLDKRKLVFSSILSELGQISFNSSRFGTSISISFKSLVGRKVQALGFRTVVSPCFFASSAALISTIAFLKNPGWVQSTRVPSPILGDDCRWVKDREMTSRHEIRVANYCQRDLIFGDLVACLNHD